MTSLCLILTKNILSLKKVFTFTYNICIIIYFNLLALIHFIVEADILNEAGNLKHCYFLDTIFSFKSKSMYYPTVICGPSKGIILINVKKFI